MIRVLCCIPLLLSLCLNPDAPARAEEPSPVAGNATKAAVPGGEPLVPAEASSASRNATDAAGALSVPPELATSEVPADQLVWDKILLRHIYTYDRPMTYGEGIPSNSGESTPRMERVFKLRVAFDRFIATQGLILCTNVGTGTVENGFMIDQEGMMEIICGKSAEDDCDANAIIIYGGTLIRRDKGESYPIMRDAMPFLLADPYVPRPVEVGGQPTSTSGSVAAKRDIQVHNEVFIGGGPGYILLRLTFPPGERERYTGFFISTSRGYCTYSDTFYTSPWPPNSVLVQVRQVAGQFREEEALSHPHTTPAYVPETTGRLGEDGVFISEAWAFAGKKKVNLLPRLAPTVFKSLPLRTADGHPLRTIPRSRRYVEWE